MKTLKLILFAMWDCYERVLVLSLLVLVLIFTGISSSIYASNYNVNANALRIVGEITKVDDYRRYDNERHDWDIYKDAYIKYVVNSISCHSRLDRVSDNKDEYHNLNVGVNLKIYVLEDAPCTAIMNPNQYSYWAHFLMALAALASLKIYLLVKQYFKYEALNRAM